MKPNTKAKWIVGITGAAFSAFVIGQLNDSASTDALNARTMDVEINNTMSEREKELVQLDWSDFAVQDYPNQGASKNDGTTRRT